MAALAAQRSAALRDARASFQSFGSYVEGLVELGQGVSLDVTVSLLGEELHASASGAGAGADTPITCIAFGLDRVTACHARFDARSAAVDEVDVEVWDADASQLIGTAHFSIVALLAGTERSLDLELPFGLTGGVEVGIMRVRVSAQPLPPREGQ